MERLSHLPQARKSVSSNIWMPALVWAPTDAKVPVVNSSFQILSVVLSFPRGSLLGTRRLLAQCPSRWLPLLGEEPEGQGEVGQATAILSISLHPLSFTMEGGVCPAERGAPNPKGQIQGGSTVLGWSFKEQSYPFIQEGLNMC